MVGSVRAAAEAVRAALAQLEPDRLSGTDCARLAEELATCEKACAGARLLLAARAVTCGGHREIGESDGPSWLARQGGTTASAGRQALGTATGLRGCSATRTALLAGEVSVAQADEIARTEAEAPGTEAALLAVARRGDLSRLRDEARSRRLAHLPVGDLHRRQHRARHLRHWRDRLGMVCVAGALPPETGVPLLHRLETLAQRSRRSQRTSTATGAEPEPFAARLADALVELARGGPDRRSPRAELVVVCDLFAWRRGHAHPDEPCHLIDGGPLPVDLAKELAQDAFVKAVLHDGVAIHTVQHFGRHLPAALKTALDLGPVPQFSGAACVDCGRRTGLEYDHVDPVANRGPTTYANLKPRCWADHEAKTERDRKAGLLGPDPPRQRSSGSKTPRPAARSSDITPGPSAGTPRGSPSTGPP